MPFSISSELEEVVRDCQRVIVLRDRAKGGEDSLEAKSTRKPSCRPSRGHEHARLSVFKRGKFTGGPALVWPVAGLAMLLLFNLVFTRGFFHGRRFVDGYLYGTLIDVLNHGAKVMLLALGMALVIATGGVDLSVGAVMAIAGAVRLS